MTYLFIADVHIKLGQKNVPTAWQRNRFTLLAEKLKELEYDTLIIGGDLLDVADPSIAEVGLMFEFLQALSSKPIIIIPGNHEMINKAVDCYTHVEAMLHSLNVRVIREFTTLDGIDYIPYNCIKKDFPKTGSSICVTHVRGEIPPHVEPEVDLEKFSRYTRVYAGDLHARSNSQLNLLYPGSPMTTSFHRKETSGENGCYLFSGDASPAWVDLGLPQLIRKSVNKAEDMEPTEYHHTIYELHGSLEELAKVKGADLLDKKITQDISAPPTLGMEGGLLGELAEYLMVVKGVKDPTEYVSLLTEVIGSDHN